MFLTTANERRFNELLKDYTTLSNLLSTLMEPLFQTCPLRSNSTQGPI